MAASDPGRQRVLKDLLESYQHSFKYTKAQGQGLRPSLSDMRERERASELCTFRVASPLCALAAAAFPFHSTAPPPPPPPPPPTPGMMMQLQPPLMTEERVPGEELEGIACMQSLAEEPEPPRHAEPSPAVLICSRRSSSPRRGAAQNGQCFPRPRTRMRS